MKQIILKKIMLVLTLVLFHEAFSQQKPAVSQAPIDRTSLTQALKPGKYTLVYDFKYDGGGAGKGGTGTISVDGKKVAEGPIERTQSGIFSVDDLADVGMDEGTQVADYGATSKFNGKIEKLKIETRK